MTLSWTVVPAPSPVRALTVAATEVGLVLVAFGDDPEAVARAAEKLGLDAVRDGDGVTEAAGQVAEYLDGRRREFTVPVDWRLTAGTQRTVLQTLYARVGYGKVVGYGELAGLSGAYAGHGYTAARGVGTIMGSNPVPVVVPCHRVMAADGPRGFALGGFGGGLATKEWLLALEGVLPPTLDLF
ncbi:methylated-DNA-[protein]-cysteine S-methyltransferase [Pseudonocardia sediminis]|uniref:Methylated-DNA-[protein]-cysteine S-methyltransferase n=1 Tax=Pseudonocardia sediminis TaxID=1397368 RepID=A0A4Q7URD5_PSEST|nr:methylated-DNA--[protein]-cysteine S-methyltransferase [Pseudonocardia sediminis]RZT83308.1 methylated-DNA-[protein]-cysteine S-methyltransferase [Pseudonocardia sediminis]